MLVTQITEQLLEGGNVFKGDLATVRINRADVEPTVKWLEKIVKLPLVPHMLGTTGRKDTSGDLDIGIQADEISKDELVARLSAWCQKNGLDPRQYIKKSGVSVHLRTPIDGHAKKGFVQTDFMFLNDREFSKWAMRGDIHKKYKDAHRHILISSIAKFHGLRWSPTVGLQSRETGQVISKDPEQIADMLLGPEARKEDLQSISRILQIVNKDPHRDAMIGEWIEAMQKEGIAVTESRIFESRGFAGRKAGDEYVNTKDPEDILVFQKLHLLPDNDIAYDSMDELETATRAFVDSYIKNPEKQNKTKLRYLNKANTGTKAAMVVEMHTPDNEEIHLFFYFTKNLANTAGKLTAIPEGGVDEPGYVLNTKASTSERFKIKPSDIVKSPAARDIRSISDLLDPAKNPDVEPALLEQMQAVIDAFANKSAKGTVLAGGAKYKSVHDKYTGEWAAPIALITGQYEPAMLKSAMEEDLLGGQDFAKGKVSFNTNPAQTLFDSIVQVGRDNVYISSKAKGGGAAASLKGLYETLTDENKRAKFKPEFWQDPKVQKFERIVKAIMEAPSIEGMMAVALIEKIIDKADATAIAEGWSGERNRTAKFKPSENLQALMNTYNANKQHPDYSPTKHALAGVSRALTRKLNAEDFTPVVKEILNHAAMVQMYFNYRIKGEDLVLDDFKLVWPPVYDGKIEFFADKAFSATEIKGRLGFSIK